MKIDALDHPKTITLSAELGISLPQTIGHLELLWAFVAQKTPQGNIGKWQNSVIAHAAQWQGDADTFVAALIKVGFFDEDQEHRLLVHDWIDHMPNWVRAKLTRSETPVFSNDRSNDGSNDASITETTREGRGGQGKPSQGKPSQGTPSNESPSTEGDGGSPDGSPPPCPYQKIVDLYHETLPMCPRVVKLTDNRKSHLRARWRNELPALEKWRNYFSHVSQSDFLTGRTNGSNGRPPFLADLDWLIKPGNLVKVAEGKYHRSADDV